MEQLYELCRTVDMGVSDAERREDKDEMLTQVSGMYRWHADARHDHPQIPSLCRIRGCNQAMPTANPFTMQVSSSLQRNNADLAEALTHALHCRLRWGGRPEDAASLAVLLLKVRIAQAQQLCTVSCTLIQSFLNSGMVPTFPTAEKRAVPASNAPVLAACTEEKRCRLR